MKRRALLQTSFLLPLTLIASNPAFASVKRLRIGVTSGPHADILRAALPVAKKNGLDIKIVEFQDYVSPNEALAAGSTEIHTVSSLSSVTTPFLSTVATLGSLVVHFSSVLVAFFGR